MLPDQELFMHWGCHRLYNHKTLSMCALVHEQREVKRSEQRYHTKAMVMSSDVTW